MVLTSPTISSITYQVLSTAQDILYTPFSSNPVECLDGYTYSAVLSTGAALPSAITFTPLDSKFTVYSLTNSSAGVYSINLRISNGVKTFTSTFTVTITEYDFCLIKTLVAPVVSNQIYYCQDPKLSLVHDPWATNSSWCIASFTYTA